MRRAFTLIELLVVIAIVSILAAILFPVFASVRERARQTTCQSNLKQIGTAFAQYLNDYDSAYPNGCSADPSVSAGTSHCTASGDPYLWTGQHFRWLVMGYLGFKQQRDPNTANTNFPWAAVPGTNPLTLVCPSDPSTAYDNTSFGYSACFYHADAANSAMTYTNLRFAPNNPGPGGICVTRLESEVAYPAQKVLIGEWLNAHRHDAGKSFGYWGSSYISTPPSADRWQGARNYAFADGHVKLIKAANVTPSAMDSCPDIHRTPNGLASYDTQ